MCVRVRACVRACERACVQLNRGAKNGNFSTMSHTEFELNLMQNDQVRVDFWSLSPDPSILHLNLVLRNPAYSLRESVACLNSSVHVHH